MVDFHYEYVIKAKGVVMLFEIIFRKYYFIFQNIKIKNNPYFFFYSETNKIEILKLYVWL